MMFEKIIIIIMLISGCRRRLWLWYWLFKLIIDNDDYGFIYYFDNNKIMNAIMLTIFTFY